MNTLQMKEQDKITAEELIATNISNILDREFKVMIGALGWLSQLSL